MLRRGLVELGSCGMSAHVGANLTEGEGGGSGRADMYVLEVGRKKCVLE